MIKELKNSSNELQQRGKIHSKHYLFLEKGVQSACVSFSTQEKVGLRALSWTEIMS